MQPSKQTGCTLEEEEEEEDDWGKQLKQVADLAGSTLLYCALAVRDSK